MVLFCIDYDTPEVRRFVRRRRMHSDDEESGR
jgi:hypothetical protein